MTAKNVVVRDALRVSELEAENRRLVEEVRRLRLRAICVVCRGMAVTPCPRCASVACDQVCLEAHLNDHRSRPDPSAKNGYHR